MRRVASFFCNQTVAFRDGRWVAPYRRFPGARGAQALGWPMPGVSRSLGFDLVKTMASIRKVDTMIVQAIGLLDELDKEINTYAMRVREWFGWHFPEMAKVGGR